MAADEYTAQAWDDIEGVAQPEAALTLIGHDAEARQLCRLYGARRLHHAWLLTGPKGIGKATLAFRFAEHLQRHPDPHAAPDNPECQDDALHRLIARNVHPNVLVLRRPWDDKAKRFRTQITAGELREGLNRFLGQAAASSAWRVVIVDSADDLNEQSANALLKLLEEPPARTVFLILAHSPRGLLPTIRSRCQMLRLRPLNAMEMRRALEVCALAESSTPEMNEQLLSLSGGSVRKAILLSGSDAVEGFDAFMKNLAAGQPDIEALHTLADALSPAARTADFEMFIELVRDHLAERVRQGAGELPLAALDQLSRLSSALVEETERVMEWNLDRKQVILDLFERMRAA